MKLLDEIRANAEELARFVEGLPADALRRPAPEGEWTLAEICGHAAEFPAFHARALKRIAEGEPGARFGRGEDDADRLSGLRRFGNAAPAEAAAAIRRGADEALAVLSDFPDEGWDAMAQSVQGDSFAVREAVESRIRDHLRAHLEQAKKAAGA